MEINTESHQKAQREKSAIIRINHRRLGNILDRLVAAHRWKEASGVLSLLLAGNPRSYSPPEDRRNFLVAMEIQKRFCRKGIFHNLIKSTYEIWLSKLSWYKKGHKKRQLLHLELALFYLTQGKFTEAQCYTRLLVSEEFGSEPLVNLIHGLILYHLWYADLPKEMQINGFDVQTSAVAFGMPMNDGYSETEIGESSNGHDAVDIRSIKSSSHCSLESSVGNQKVIMEGEGNEPRKKPGDTSDAHDNVAESLEDDEELLQRNPDNFINTSIYFASGIDKILLPMQLKLLAEDPVQSILLHRKLVNEKYINAEKHLRLALHSTPPLLAALLPLIQLLLLGDRVNEAIVELEISCQALDLSLPFRLKAKILECFCTSQITMIASCYENALTRDPACTYSMERLIKMHKAGNYGTTQLLEMLASHLDAAAGKCSIWIEFASCFLQLQTVFLFGYEGCISSNVGGVTDNIYCNKIPIIFSEGETGDTWRLRCRWWISCHFSRSICLSEIQAGEWMLLQAKAACAAHLYGPDIEYVSTAINSFAQQGCSDGLSYLQKHIRNAMNLRKNLEELIDDHIL